MTSRQSQSFVVQDLSNEAKIDQKRLYEVCSVLEAVGFLKRSGRLYIYCGHESLNQVFGAFVTDLCEGNLPFQKIGVYQLQVTTQSITMEVLNILYRQGFEQPVRFQQIISSFNGDKKVPRIVQDTANVLSVLQLVTYTLSGGNYSTLTLHNRNYCQIAKTVEYKQTPKVQNILTSIALKQQQQYEQNQAIQLQKQALKEKHKVGQTNSLNYSLPDIPPTLPFLTANLSNDPLLKRQSGHAVLSQPDNYYAEGQEGAIKQIADIMQSSQPNYPMSQGMPMSQDIFEFNSGGFQSQ